MASSSFLFFFCCCCPSVAIRSSRSNRKRQKLINLPSSSLLAYPIPQGFRQSFSKSPSPRRVSCVPKSREEDDAESEEPRAGIGAGAIEEAINTKDFVTIAACLVGLLTGVGVVLFNTAVHEIRDFFWDGLPLRGASFLREEPIEVVWQRVILVPVCGGVIVGMLNSLRSYLKSPSKDIFESNVKGALRPFLKAVAASVTLGTGNSLGPEGPNVEIGSSIAKGVGQLFEWKGGRRLALIASGSAAGISSVSFKVEGRRHNQVNLYTVVPTMLIISSLHGHVLKAHKG